MTVLISVDATNIRIDWGRQWQLMPLSAAIPAAGPKPPLSASATVERQYGERLSLEVALVVASELRKKGAGSCQPDPLRRGRELQFAGGIGAKKVDVNFATEVAGPILGVSIKTINFRDGETKNYQNNLTNRRGDMLAEVTTLHQRFPYAVIGGNVLLNRMLRPMTPRAALQHSSLLTTFSKRSLGVTKRTDAVEIMEAIMIGVRLGATVHDYAIQWWRAKQADIACGIPRYVVGQGGSA